MLTLKIDVVLRLGAIALLITNNDNEAHGNNVAWLYLKRVLNAFVRNLIAIC
jgi:hypothetical protein